MRPAPLASRPTGVLLVGCGAVARSYWAPALAALARVGRLEVRALCDPDTDAVRELGRAFPAAARVAVPTDARDVGLAIVASPPRYHAEQTIALLDAGVPVLCEKPLAATLAEAEAVVAAARASGRVAAVGLFRRFFPATRAVRRLLATGVLGEPTGFTIFEGGPFAWPTRSPGFFQRAGLQGGVLLDMGVHVLDLLGWWFGPPRAVFYEDDARGGIEANCRIRLEYAGFAGEVRLSRDWALPNRWVVTGRKGRLTWEANEADRLGLAFAGADEWTFDARLHEPAAAPAFAPGPPAAGFEESFVAQLANVLDAVAGAAPLAVPVEEALPSLALIERCYRERRPLAMPWLGPDEAAAAARLGGGTA